MAPVFAPKYKGSSLLELLVVLSVLAILAATSVPITRDSLVQARLNHKVALLAHSLNYAREQAVYSGHPIEICAATDCTGKNNWGSGWQARTREFDTIPVLTVLLADSDIKIFKFQPNKAIVYSKSSFVPLHNTHFTLCSALLPHHRRQLYLSSYGRVRIAEETTSLNPLTCTQVL